MAVNGRSPVVNIDKVLADPGTSQAHGPRGPFEARLGLIGHALGSNRIGINVTVVPAGKRAWPRHWHYGNDELFVVLDGAGTLHYGEADYPLAAGDVVHISAGTGVPFQIENTSGADLRYLAISTQDAPDVVVYPDSGKTGIFAGKAPLGPAPAGRPAIVRFVPDSASAGYWHGEVEEG
ncbi:MAG: cupin domain-containing protein [Pseudomonadota bacterium]